MLSSFTTKLPHLLDLLYAAALQPERTSEFFDALSRAFDDGQGVVRQVYADYTTSSIAYGVEPSFGESFVSHYSALNPFTGELLASMPTGKVMFASDLVPEAELVKTEFYNGWMRPQNASPHHCGVAFGDSCGNRSILTVSPRCHRFSERREEYAKCIALLVPHLARASEISSLAHAASAVTTDRPDAFDAPSVIVRDEGRIHAANHAAESLLREGDPLWRTAAGYLRARRSGQDAALRAAVKLALRPQQASPSGPIRIESERSGTAYLCWVIPSTALANERHVLFPVGRYARVVVQVVSCAEPIRSETLRAAFDITAAEARLLSALIAGQTVDEYAAWRGVSRHTVKNQLSSLFEKTNTKRQAELVSLVINSIRVK